MMSEVFRALLQALAPVATTSFVLSWWSLKRGYVKPGTRMSLLKTQLGSKPKKQSPGKQQTGCEGVKKSGNKWSKTDPVYKKWMKFGGGFYGVVALQTYLLIEFREIMNFIDQYDGLAGLLSQLGPGLLISFLVESLKNFVAAIAWPVAWLQELEGEYFLVWLAAAWIGYRLGIYLALKWHQSPEFVPE